MSFLGIACAPAGSALIAELVATLIPVARSSSNGSGWTLGPPLPALSPSKTTLEGFQSPVESCFCLYMFLAMACAGTLRAQPLTITTVAGPRESAGSIDETGAAARFNTPIGIATDSSGNVYVVDSGNYTVRVISPAGVVSTLAGLAHNGGTADATGSDARF